MNQKQAIAKLTKIIGPKIGWRINSKALDEAGRAEQLEAGKAMRATERTLKDALDARRAELLKDPVYVDLRNRWNVAKDAADKALSRSHSKPIEVGRTGELFFTVLASGDSWEDVVEKLSAERRQ